MRSAWVRALHESPEDAESLCFAQEDCQKAAAAPHSEGAGPTDRGLLSRGSHRAPVPRRRAPQLTAREASPGSQAALRRECLAGQPSLEYRDRNWLEK